jgi:anti-sigma regulatory factor (Ser/Thr protein kinase)
MNAEMGFGSLVEERPDALRDIPSTVSMRFEAGPTAAATARGALVALGDQLEGEVLDDARLLISELVTNSVRHASVTGSVGLDIRVSDETLHVEVSDPGNGFNPAPRRFERTEAGGWGLHLVDRLADRWGVLHNGVTSVWFEIDGAFTASAAAL